MKKKTEKEIEVITEEMGYDILSYYRNERGRKIAIIKDKNGYKYKSALFNLIRGETPYFVHLRNPFSLENISIWLLKNNKKFKLLDENVYRGNSEKLFFICLVCNEIFDSTWNWITNMNCECPFCAGKRIGKINNLSIVKPDLISDWDYDKNKIAPINFTSHSNQKVWWRCRICDFEWETRVADRFMGSGCPKCDSSRGEKIIYNFLFENKIDFKKEFPLLGCKYKGQLRVDFYLPSHNLVIEYNGNHHYQPVRFSYSVSEEKALENFENQKKKDKIKEEYCITNKINLLVIPYWDYDDIENILNFNLLNLF